MYYLYLPFEKLIFNIGKKFLFVLMRNMTFLEK